MPVSPAQPISMEVETGFNKKGLFTLYYREGQNPHAVFKIFLDSGEFRGIIERAKKFCERTNKRFVRCEPTIINFDDEEKRLAGDQ